MQLYECKTLKEMLENENREINRNKNLNIFKQIVEGLEHIHSKKIIHRDVKPGNIFIANDGTVKVVKKWERVSKSVDWGFWLVYVARTGNFPRKFSGT